MSALRGAAQQALEALELYVPKEDYENKPVGNAMDALRAALAQEQDEPEPWTPAALGSSLKLWFDPANPWASVQAEAEPAQQVMQDAVTTGVGIICGREHIDPASIYKQAEPAQEPVAWYCNKGLKRGVSLKQESPEWIPLYTKEKP